MENTVYVFLSKNLIKIFSSIEIRDDGSLDIGKKYLKFKN